MPLPHSIIEIPPELFESLLRIVAVKLALLGGGKSLFVAAVVILSATAVLLITVFSTIWIKRYFASKAERSNR
jgi:hypothetical protein